MKCKTGESNLDLLTYRNHEKCIDKRVPWVYIWKKQLKCGKNHPVFIDVTIDFSYPS